MQQIGAFLKYAKWSSRRCSPWSREVFNHAELSNHCMNGVTQTSPSLSFPSCCLHPSLFSATDTRAQTRSHKGFVHNLPLPVSSPSPPPAALPFSPRCHLHPLISPMVSGNNSQQQISTHLLAMWRESEHTGRCKATCLDLAELIKVKQLFYTHKCPPID